MVDDVAAPAWSPDAAAEAYRQAGMVNPTLVIEGGRSYYKSGATGNSVGDGEPTGPSPFRGPKTAPVVSGEPSGPSPFAGPSGSPGGAQPTVSAVSAAGTGALSGMTLGATPDAAGLAAAGEHATGGPIKRAINMGVGALNLGIGALTGDDAASQRFQQGRQDQKNVEAAASSQQPFAYYPAELAGGVAAPIGGALKTTATYGMRAWEGLRIAGTTGAISGFFSGDNLHDRVVNSSIGLAAGSALGGALPYVAGGIVQGAKSVGHALHLDQLPDAWRAWRNPSSVDDVAARHVGDAALKNRGTEFKPGDATFADQNGIPIANVDTMGEEGRSLLRTQTNISPTAQQDAKDYFEKNDKSFAERTVNFVKSFAPLGGNGRAPMREEMRDLARQQNAPAYTKAYAAGDKAIYSPELERLSSAPEVKKAIEGAMERWRNWQVIDGFGALNPPFQIKNGGLVSRTGGQLPVWPNIQLWDYAARVLTGKAQAAPPGGEEQAMFTRLAAKVKAELDRVVPEYGEARGGAAKHFGAADAYDAGGEFVSRKMDMSEAELAHKDFKPAEKALFKEGFFGGVATQVSQTGRRTQLLDTIERSPDAQARVKLAADGDPTVLGKFVDYMRIQHITELSKRALGNSTTMKQLIANGAVGVTAGAAEGWVQGDGVSPTKILAVAIGAGLNAGKQRINTQLANKITEMLLSNDPKVLQRAVEISRNNSAVKEGIRNVELLFERAIGEGAGRASANNQ